jgi:uncharacterized protein YjbI with pentapeptide repeats/Cdc6-like AAA superfamily ATPase
MGQEAVLVPEGPSGTGPNAGPVTGGPARQELAPLTVPAGRRCATTVDELKDLLRRGEIELFNQLRPTGALDLSGMELKHLDLRKANLSRCKLVRANLFGCRLEGTDLSQADLTRAELGACWMAGTSFQHAVLDYASLAGVKDAQGADFQCARLVRADLNSGNFTGALFNHARLDGATLSSGNFSNAEFVDALLPGALLHESCFRSANMERARLFQASGRDVNFSEANLCDAEAVNTRFSSSGLTRADKSVVRTSFEGAWVHGLVHDGFGSEESLLSDARQGERPPEGMFPVRLKPELKKREIPGMPGTDLDLYEKAMAELDGLIGLKEVKTHVKEQLAMMRFQRARAERGLAEADLNLHFVFTGAPGTGKTTVARIISNLLYATGYLKKGHLVEVQKSNLIAGYQGQTPIKTEEAIGKALDGCLFIDEAYSLTQNENDDYSKDCIATLLKMMEDHRGRLSVIVAGYSKEMETFIKANSGLESRFTVYIDFPDYSNGELVDIMKRMLDGKQFTCDGKTLGQASIMLAVMRAIKDQSGEGGKTFANARAVRNLVQDLVMRMARRVEGKLDAPDALTKVEPEDLPFKKVLDASPETVDFSVFRWAGADGKELTIDELPATGTFPELTPQSKELAEGIAQLRTLERTVGDPVDDASALEESSGEVLSTAGNQMAGVHEGRP